MESTEVVLAGLEAVGAEVVKRPVYGGVQVIIRFPNGYGLSVINHEGSYGVEAAVVCWEDASDPVEEFELNYSTPITSDVLGWLTPEQLDAAARAVLSLPSYWTGELDDVDKPGELGL